MKQAATALPLILLFGCTTIAPPTEVARLKASGSFLDTVRLLIDMTDKCWAIPPHPLKDGILVNQYKSNEIERFVITGRRATWRHRIAENPFVIITVLQSNDDTLVSVQEGDYAAGLTDEIRLNAANHVQAWLEGSRECAKFAHALW